MQLRNQKDTVELSVEELKREVYPDNLDVPYSWPAAPGEPVWVKVDRKWKKGVVLEDHGHAWTDRVHVPLKHYQEILTDNFFRDLDATSWSAGEAAREIHTQTCIVHGGGR